MEHLIRINLGIVVGLVILFLIVVVVYFKVGK